MTTGRVLCVDPDPEARAATATALSEAGFDVTTAADAAAARAALDPPPDCVVTETDLPDGDGLALIASARERDGDVAGVLFTAAGYGEIDTDRHDVVVEVVSKTGPAAHERLVSMVTVTVEHRSQTVYPLPDDETERLAALERYDLDDAATLRALDRLTALAASRFDVPMASVNIVGERDQHLLACQGIADEWTPRDQSVCTYTILDDEVTVIEDVHDDPRFDGVASIEDLGIRFYAGAPVHTPAGRALGTVCVYDDEPRSFDAAAAADLERIAAEAAEQLELRRRLAAADGADPHVAVGADAEADAGIGAGAGTEGDGR
jgi:GAF domain-containing protein